MAGKAIRTTDQKEALTMKVLAVAFALGAGLLFIPRTFGSAPVYLAQADTFEISGQTGDDTTNEQAPPEVNDTGS